MAEFFTGDLLNHEILQIIKRPRATEIVLASPYIKFHQRMRQFFLVSRQIFIKRVALILIALKLKKKHLKKK